MVYAVEASALANIIPKVAKENNFSEVIKVCDAISKQLTSHITTSWLIYAEKCYLVLEIWDFIMTIHYISDISLAFPRKVFQ
jgi:hypothetical protein